MIFPEKKRRGVGDLPVFPPAFSITSSPAPSPPFPAPLPAPSPPPPLSTNYGMLAIGLVAVLAGVAGVMYLAYERSS